MDHDPSENKLTMRTPRILPDGGIMVAGETAVVETDRIITAYIPSTAQSGQVFRLLNTSDHDVVVAVEQDAFNLEMVNADPEPTATIRPATMFFGVMGWSERHQAMQVFSCITSDGGGTGPSGDFLPRVNPGFAGNMVGPYADLGGMKAGEAEFALVGITGNLTVGEDESKHVLITPDFVDIKGHMGESNLNLSATALTAGNLNVVDIESTSILLQAPNLTVRATTTTEGPGDLELRAQRNVTVGALNGNVFVAAQSLVIAPSPTTDMIASFDNTVIVFGDPVTGYQDNPTLKVMGDAEFAMNPTLKSTIAAAELDDMALVTKGQVFDVLNGARSTMLPGPTSGIVDASHFGKLLRPSADITLPDLGAENGIIDMISDVDVTVSLASNHPGTLMIDGVNRGPTLVIPRGMYRKLIQLDGNWFIS